jgi:elongation factor Ts
MAMIKELREQTGAPIVDVKKALVESDCDLSEARLWLRNKGLAKAQKKAGRLTAEGLVAVASDAGESGFATRVSAAPRDRRPLSLGTQLAHLRAQIAMVELACETDFVARNSQFQQAADDLAQSLLVSSPDFTSGSTASELAEQLAASEGVAEQIGLLSATVGENVTIRRAGRLVLPEGSEGVVSCYVHGALSSSTGQIASAVVLCAEPGSTDHTSIALMGEYGKRLAMQVVAARPLYATRDDVPDDMVAAEKATILQEVRHSLPPTDIRTQTGVC